MHETVWRDHKQGVKAWLTASPGAQYFPVVVPYSAGACGADLGLLNFLRMGSEAVSVGVYGGVYGGVIAALIALALPAARPGTARRPGRRSWLLRTRGTTTAPHDRQRTRPRRDPLSRDPAKTTPGDNRTRRR